MRCVAAGQFKVKDILQDVILQHLITTEILITTEFLLHIDHQDWLLEVGRSSYWTESNTSCVPLERELEKP